MEERKGIEESGGIVKNEEIRIVDEREEEDSFMINEEWKI